MSEKDREALAREHMYLVDYVAGIEARRLGKGVDVEDLRSFAREGLAQAIDRYDAERGALFKTFALPRLRGAVYDGLSKAGWFPRRLHRKIAFFRNARDIVEARAQDSQPSTDTEVVQELADTLKELAMAYVTSWSADDDSRGEPPQKDQATAEEWLAEQQYFAQVREAVDSLPERQAQIVRGYFYQERSLVDLSLELGITASWASKLLSGALNTLRHRFAVADKNAALHDP